jgi:hypothetical protein
MTDTERRPFFVILNEGCRSEESFTTSAPWGERSLQTRSSRSPPLVIWRASVERDSSLRSE